MSDFHIEPYRKESRTAIVILMKEFGEYIESIDDIKRTEYKEGGSEYFTDKMIREVQANKGAIFIAYSQDQAVGFIGGYVGKQDKDEEMEAVKLTPGIINEFFVTTSSRGKRIGEKLLITLEGHLKRQGCDILRLEVFAPNMVARNFYKKHGFKERMITLSKQLHSL